MGVLPCSGRAQKITRRRAVKKRSSPSLSATIARFGRNATLATAVIGWASWGGLDQIAAFTRGAQTTAPPEAGANTPQDVWVVDADGDGIADFANPTHGYIRGEDAYGSGSFGTVRDGGKRKHHGVDYIAEPGDWVEAPIAGIVTKHGYAYKRSDLRFIEIKNTDTGMRARVLYVDASIQEGAVVAAGEVIGTAQDLAKRYPGGITNHVHVELTNARGALLDPATLLPLGEDHFAANSTPGRVSGAIDVNAPS